MKVRPGRGSRERLTRAVPFLVAIVTAACQFAPPAAATPSAIWPGWPIDSGAALSAHLPTATRDAGTDRAPVPDSLDLDPAAWHEWPVVSVVPEHARRIYLRGQQLGNDPHAFSVFGDCQAVPTQFVGAYESSPALYAGLPAQLQETVDWFRGSFNRVGPTVGSGTTAGALLWTLWHQNKFTCTSYETPLECELRIHEPAYVIIQLGTHYEDRNEEYMRTVLDRLIAAGVVPILATKADNRELDEHINLQYAQLAVEYDIPFWNFWAAVQHLPDQGVFSRVSEPFPDYIYLTTAATAVRRHTALQMLDAVRRAVTAP